MSVVRMNITLPQDPVQHDNGGEFNSILSEPYLESSITVAWAFTPIKMIERTIQKIKNLFLFI